ncbi:MAG: prepilin-type N-terminal cleavage/methylation domain-containing protein [Verrucomicrobiota bacterium]
MRPPSYRSNAFTLLELLLALGLFSIAAVSLAQAINLISLSVSESIEENDLREQVRGVLLEATRDPNLEAGTRSIPTEGDLVFEVVVDQVNLNNREGNTLEGVFEVKVVARRELPGVRSQVVAEADTWAYDQIYRRTP